MSESNLLIVEPKKFSFNEVFKLESGEKLNGFEFNGSKLRVELSEKKDSATNKRNSGKSNKNKKRKDFKKIVHSDAPNLEAPDPRWAGELSKLKDLLANQKTPA